MQYIDHIIHILLSYIMIHNNEQQVKQEFKFAIK